MSPDERGSTDDGGVLFGVESISSHLMPFCDFYSHPPVRGMLMLRRSIFCSICNIILVLCISTTSNVLGTWHPGYLPTHWYVLRCPSRFMRYHSWIVRVARVGALSGSTGNVLRVWVQDPHTQKNTFITLHR